MTATSLKESLKLRNSSKKFEKPVKYFKF